MNYEVLFDGSKSAPWGRQFCGPEEQRKPCVDVRLHRDAQMPQSHKSDEAIRQEIAAMDKLYEALGV